MMQTDDCHDVDDAFFARARRLAVDQSVGPRYLQSYVLDLYVWVMKMGGYEPERATEPINGT